MNIIKKLAIVFIIMSIINLVFTLIFAGLKTADTLLFKEFVWMESNFGIVMMVYFIIQSVVFLIISIIQLVHIKEMKIVTNLSIASGIIALFTSFIVWIPVIGITIAAILSIALMILNILIINTKIENEDLDHIK